MSCVARPLPLLSHHLDPVRYLVKDVLSRRVVPHFSVALVLLALAACKGSESANAGAPTPGTPGWTPDAKIMATAGDVVIAAPSVRYTGGPVATPGSVKGTVSMASPLAPLPPVAVGRDSAVCNGATVPDSSVQQRGTGLGNVVVWLDGVRKGKTLSLEKRLELESDHCLLTPRVQAAMTGSAVNVIGHDDFRQHLHFFSAGEKAPRATVLLGKDEQVIPTEHPASSPGLVFVRDVDHPWPAAYIAVFDHPYYAVTKPDGSFTIDGVPPGEYTLVAWHERTKKVQQGVTITANGVATVKLALDAKN
jgi:Carboxypeptidase regulatory-like domain